MLSVVREEGRRREGGWTHPMMETMPIGWVSFLRKSFVDWAISSSPSGVWVIIWNATGVVRPMAIVEDCVGAAFFVVVLGGGRWWSLEKLNLDIIGRGGWRGGL